MRRRVAIVLALLILALGSIVAWVAADLPPIRYLFRYGLAPGCEPTGETLRIEGVEFVEIGPGIARMGSRRNGKGGDLTWRISHALGLPWGRPPKPSPEMPVHWVDFADGFWIARTEITNGQYERFDPEHERPLPRLLDSYPVSNLSRDEAKAFCAWLAERSGEPVRLPSEAEWEAACRAGSRSEYCFGDDPEGLEEYGWVWPSTLQRIAAKRPNAWGLFDMHGNAPEICEDTWHRSYDGAPTDGSAWVETPGEPWVVRGGDAWYLGSDYRSAARDRQSDWTGTTIGVPSVGSRASPSKTHRIPARVHGLRPAFVRRRAEN